MLQWWRNTSYASLVWSWFKFKHFYRILTCSKYFCIHYPCSKHELVCIRSPCSKHELSCIRSPWSRHELLCIRSPCSKHELLCIRSPCSKHELLCIHSPCSRHELLCIRSPCSKHELLCISIIKITLYYRNKNRKINNMANINNTNHHCHRGEAWPHSTTVIVLTLIIAESLIGNTFIILTNFLKKYKEGTRNINAIITYLTIVDVLVSILLSINIAWH